MVNDLPIKLDDRILRMPEVRETIGLSRVAFFMHMKWERLVLSYAILLPPIAVMLFVAIMVFDSGYTVLARFNFFDGVEQTFGH